MAIKSLDLAGLMLYDGKIKQYIATLAGNTASSAISTHNSDINAHSTLLAGYVKTSRQIAGKALTSDITSAELTAALNEATTSLKGLMSAMDKTRLDNLWAVFDNGENENFVDTLTEILEIFQNYPEGADIMAKLNQKVDKVDGKGLSTNDYTDADKSKVDSIDARDASTLQAAKDYTDVLGADVLELRGKVEDIEDGTTVVKRAEQDEDGNNIRDTYATLADLAIEIDDDVEVI